MVESDSVGDDGRDDVGWRGGVSRARTLLSHSGKRNGHVLCGM